MREKTCCIFCIYCKECTKKSDGYDCNDFISDTPIAIE